MITWNDTSDLRVDDPYYYLYYSSKLRPPSYFSLEKEMPEVGRVLRFDSLSKIVAAGIRIGFASGPEPLLRAIDGYVRPSFLTTFFFFVLIHMADGNVQFADLFLYTSRRFQATRTLGPRRVQGALRTRIGVLYG